MVDEYDSFCKGIRRTVHENQDQGNLDLGTKHLHAMTYVCLAYTSEAGFSKACDFFDTTLYMAVSGLSF